MFRGNGHRREEAKDLRKKLDAVKQSIRDGDDGWRNWQRKRYLERRLDKKSDND